jgi:hypothetical protein
MRAHQQNQQGKKSKRQGKQPAAPSRDTQGSDNNTIERYFVRSQPSAAASNGTREEGELSGASYLEEPAANSESNLVEELLGSTIPGGPSEWS